MKKTIYYTFILVAMSLLISSCSKDEDDETSSNGGKAPSSVKAVDLGLPSGTLWATCNVGANSPEEYGNYYAWGETKAYGEEDTSNINNYSYNGNSSYKKTYYDWRTYKWYNGSNTYYMTKYNIDGGGTIDNMTILELADDAAYVNWGKNWRMPTRVEQDELHTNCYWVWTKSYNNKSVSGYIVYKQKSTADTGLEHGSSYSYTISDTHIFLPAAGSYLWDFMALSENSPEGEYWSSSLYEDHKNGGSDESQIMTFRSFEINHSKCSRWIGGSIRPVRSK